MSEKTRPGRIELFAYYYLGFQPDGTYRFPNAHHVAKWYKVGPEAILRWLEEYDLAPTRLSRLQIELSRHSVDLQMDAPNLTPEGVLARAEEILEELEEAQPGRRPWIDGPIQ